MRTVRRCRSHAAMSSPHSIFLTRLAPTLFVGISFPQDNHGPHVVCFLMASARPHAKPCSHFGMCFRSLPPTPISMDGSPTRKQLRPHMCSIVGFFPNSTTRLRPSRHRLRASMPSADPVESRNSSMTFRIGMYVGVGPASGNPATPPPTPPSTSASPPFLRY